MDDVDRALIELAARQHHVFSRAQARAAGLSESALSKRIARRALIACGKRALHLPGVALTYQGQLMAGLLDLGPEALISSRAAAHLLGLDGFAAGPREFLVPRSLRNRTTLGTARSTASITPLDRTVVDGLRCTSATRTIIELLGAATRDEVGNALDSATRKRLTAPSVVARRLTELGRQGRERVGTLDDLLRAGVVESWLERRLLAVVRRAGLPALVTQKRYELPGLGAARVDFEFLTYPIVVEVGGQRGYLSLDERGHQEHRRTALQLAGKTVYFFTTDDVTERPEFVVRTLFAALEAELVTKGCLPGKPA